MAMGTNNYPKSVNETMNILHTFAKTIKTVYGKKLNYKAEGKEVAFAQTRDLSKITCYHCGKKGHFAKTCPKKLKKDKFILNCPKLISKKVMMKMTWGTSAIKTYQV